MEEMICIDSDFLIDFLRNNKESVEWIKQNGDKEFATTIINVFELYYGEYKKTKNDLKKLDAFLAQFRILSLDVESTKRAGQIAALLEKEGTTVDFRDILIGSISLTNNAQLKTNNKKHFERIKELNIL